MDKAFAESLAQKIQISKDFIVREEFEMLVLKEIYESEFGSSLMFKGGTALRLAYGSPRFSEDLDFTLIAHKINKKKLIKFLEGIESKYPDIIDVDAYEKYYTLFALIKIKVDYLDNAFSIKIEISKRKSPAGKFLKDKDYTDKVIKSEVSPLTVLARVASLDLILKEKNNAIANRKAARDVFDHWFINQLMKKEVKVNFSGFDKKQVVSELHKLLEQPYWRVIESWLE